MTPTPTDRSAYVERFLRVMKVLRAGNHPDEEALDPQRAERAFERGVKRYDDEDQATSEAARRIEQKLSKGFEEVED